MNSKSLDKELKNLKHYLKETKSLNETTDKNQKKIITYTLVGMIMSLYNLIKTGAYDEQNKSELFKITEEARNTAIHYGYFNDFNNIYPAANQITNNIPSHQQTHFAQIIKSSPPINHEYCQIYTNENTEIKPLKSMNDFIVFSNKKTGEELYVKKKDLIIV